MRAAPQIRMALTENSKALHLPAMRECFEQAAQQASLLPSQPIPATCKENWMLSENTFCPPSSPKRFPLTPQVRRD